jgi:hypothetical protein
MRREMSHTFTVEESESTLRQLQERQSDLATDDARWIQDGYGLAWPEQQTTWEERGKRLHREVRKALS